MRFIFLILALVLGITTSKAQTSFELPFSIRVVNPMSVDYKYLKDGVVGYADTTEVNQSIPLGIRHEGLLVYVNDTLWIYKGGISDTNLTPLANVIGAVPGGSGITSVGLIMPPAFDVSNSPLTSDGTIVVQAMGDPTQYITGAGTLEDMPDFSLYLQITDTSQMLEPYLKKIDTVSLSDRIDFKEDIFEKGNIVEGDGIVLTGSGVGRLVGQTSLTISSDFSSVVKYTDTTAMLQDYLLVSDTIGFASRDWVQDQNYLDSEIDGDTTNELQTLTFDNITGDLSITQGNTVTIPIINPNDYVQFTDTVLTIATKSDIIAASGGSVQSLSSTKTGTNVALGITAGGVGTVFNISDPDSSNTNELQILQWDGNTKELSITQGNTVAIPTGDIDTSWLETAFIQNQDSVTQSAKMRISGTASIGAANNPGNIVTRDSATGLLSERTPSETLSDIGGVSLQDAFRFKGFIPTSGSDLNDYVEIGLYQQSSNTGAAVGQNYPIDLAGMLEVYVNQGATRLTQRYTPYNFGMPGGTYVSYERAAYTSGSTRIWGEWVPNHVHYGLGRAIQYSDWDQIGDRGASHFFSGHITTTNMPPGINGFASGIYSGYSSTNGWSISSTRAGTGLFYRRQVNGVWNDYRKVWTEDAFTQADIDFWKSTLPANAFVRGGNTYSTTADLGTNDNYSLRFKTGNIFRGGFFYHATSPYFWLGGTGIGSDGTRFISTGTDNKNLYISNRNSEPGDNEYGLILSGLAVQTETGHAANVKIQRAFNPLIGSSSSYDILHVNGTTSDITNTSGTLNGIRITQNVVSDDPFKYRALYIGTNSGWGIYQSNPTNVYNALAGTTLLGTTSDQGVAKVQILGGLQLRGLDNSTGDVLTIDSLNVVKRRTIAQLVSDAGLSPISMNTNRLLGRYSSGTGSYEEITIGSGLNLSSSGVLTSTGGGAGDYIENQTATTQTANARISGGIWSYGISRRTGTSSNSTVYKDVLSKVVDPGNTDLILRIHLPAISVSTYITMDVTIDEANNYEPGQLTISGACDGLTWRSDNRKWVYSTNPKRFYRVMYGYSGGRRIIEIEGNFDVLGAPTVNIREVRAYNSGHDNAGWANPANWDVTVHSTSAATLKTIQRQEMNRGLNFVQKDEIDWRQGSYKETFVTPEGSLEFTDYNNAVDFPTGVGAGIEITPKTPGIDPLTELANSRMGATSLWKERDADRWWLGGYNAGGLRSSWSELWHSNNFDPVTKEDVITVSPGAIMGRYSATPGSWQEITVGSTLDLSPTGELNAIVGAGTVTSVDMSVPDGFVISGNPVTTTGTLALDFDYGYSLPTTAEQSAWSNKQNALNGTGFVKAAGTSITYDNSTYTKTTDTANMLLPYLRVVDTIGLASRDWVIDKRYQDTIKINSGTLSGRYSAGIGGLEEITLGSTMSLSPTGELNSISSGSGTVTSVGVSVPTGFSVSNSPITSSGVVSIDFASGYSLPSNATQSAWSAKQDAINGTGFVKASGTTITYDNSTYTNTNDTANMLLPYLRVVDTVGLASRDWVADQRYQDTIKINSGTLSGRYSAGNGGLEEITLGNLTISPTGVLNAPDPVTNLGLGSPSATVVEITNSNGSGVNIPSVTTTEAGVLSSTDKIKLDSISSGAYIPNVTLILQFSSITMNKAFFQKIGDIVSVTGSFTATPDGYGNCQLGIDLPFTFHSAQANIDGCSGFVRSVSSENNGEVFALMGQTDQVILSTTTTNIAGDRYIYSFSYQITN